MNDASPVPLIMVLRCEMVWLYDDKTSMYPIYKMVETCHWAAGCDKAEEKLRESQSGNRVVELAESVVPEQINPQFFPPHWSIQPD